MARLHSHATSDLKDSPRVINSQKDEFFKWISNHLVNSGIIFTLTRPTLEKEEHY
jgi:hypothetical protein